MTRKKRILFIDRDGTLIKEAPPTYQLDSFAKLEFYPAMFTWMRKIAIELDFELVMVTNQDGLGSPSFPEETFWPVHYFVMKSLENEDIHFSEVCIDRTLPADNAPTRKPGTGMLTKYISSPEYDLPGSFVIGDRITDMKLAKNLGCKAIWINSEPGLGQNEIAESASDLRDTIVLQTTNWQTIYGYLWPGVRLTEHERNTSETKIRIKLNLDGTGESSIHTGLHFFDHMLEQVSRHSGIDFELSVQGDLKVDEHHTIEDTGIVLGEAIAMALGTKRGIERFGFCLPMDDCQAQTSIDFGGRNWLVWEADFKREKIGDMPTEMFSHFFKSFCDGARCSLHVKAYGQNEHHKIEAIFKSLARSLKAAVRIDATKPFLPSTKGTL